MSYYGGTPLLRRPRHNEKHLKARQNYSKICGNELRYDSQATQNVPRCHGYCVQSLASLSKNDRFLIETTACFIPVLTNTSLRSKRFRLVSEQKKDRGKGLSVLTP